MGWWVLRTLDRSLSIVSFLSLTVYVLIYRVHAERDRYGCDCMFKRARLKDYSEKRLTINPWIDRDFMMERTKVGDGVKRDISVVQNDWIKLHKLHRLSCL